MKIRVLLYITPKKFKWKYIVNWLITIWTMSRYSHCEIWTPEEVEGFSNVFEEMSGIPGFYGGDDYFGTCYTATMRGKANGTVKRDASEVLDHPEHWDYVEIEIDANQYQSLLTWMKTAVASNKGYARRDLLKFIFPYHRPDDERYICSEFVNEMLFFVGFFWEGGIISPKALAKKLLKKGYEIQSLKG